MKFHLLTTLVAALLLQSCVPNKKLVILQDKSLKRPQDKVYHHQLSNSFSECTLAIGDVVLVEITYVDLLETSQMHQVGSDLSVGRASGYEIDGDGQISLPLIGSVELLGLTVGEARELIVAKADKYYVQPSVKVVMQSAYLTVLGEVLRPGRYQIAKCGTPILELLGMAGGTTTMADLEEVKVVRTRGDSTEVYFLDLTDEALLISPLYYTLPDDVIYVKPLKRKALTFQESQQVFRGLGIIISVVSLSVAISKL